MAASPIPRGSFVLGRFTIMPSAKIGAAFRVFVRPKIFVVSMPIRNFFYFVALFSKDDELFLSPFRSAFRFVEAWKSFSSIRNFPRREPLELFSSHLLASFLPLQEKSPTSFSFSWGRNGRSPSSSERGVVREYQHGMLPPS